MDAPPDANSGHVSSWERFGGIPLQPLPSTFSPPVMACHAENSNDNYNNNHHHHHHHHLVGHGDSDNSQHPPRTALKLLRSQSDSSVRGSRTVTRNKTQRRETIDIGGPVTYTPATHRVSKAKKGKRVHACQFPGCTKVFTRAEHRRRHELNHNPHSTYTCTVEGCGKGFHRSDLLSRHMEKHDSEFHLVKPASSHKRRQSQLSESTERDPTPSPTPAEQQQTPASVTTQPPVTPTIHPQQPAVASPYVNDINFSPSYWSASRGESDSSITGNSHVTYVHNDGPGVFSSPECSQSPTSDSSSFHFPTPQVTNVDQFQEPIIDSLLMGSMQYYPNMAGFDPFESSGVQQSSRLITLPIEGDSVRAVGEPSRGSKHDSCYRNQANMFVSVPLPLSRLDGDEWSALQCEFASICGTFPTNNVIGLIDPVKWTECLEYYWQYFHPLYPIVHRPSFLATRASPLLVGAMVAIGYQYDRTLGATVHSLALLEACQKLTSKKKSITSQSLVSDIQTVFLLEILSKYRSRRADVSISPRLRRLYGSFVQDRRWVTQNPLSLLNSSAEDKSSAKLERAHKFWVEHETRRRVMQAMFILDVHQSILFQQPLAFLWSIPGGLVPKYRSSGFLDLPFPCNPDLWECGDVASWAECAAKSGGPTTLAAASDQMTTSGTSNLDPFQSILILSYNMLKTRGVVETSMGSFTENNLEDFVSGNIPSLQFIYHALLAAHYSPLQALITVSNESWLFNRKVTDENQFKTAKRTLRTWVSDSEQVKKAVWHAVRVLEYTLTAYQETPSLGPSPNSLPGENALLYTPNGYFNQDVMQIDPFIVDTMEPNTPTSAYLHSLQPSFADKGQSRQRKSTPLSPSEDPLTMLQAKWAVYLSSLICWAYGFGATSATTPSHGLPSPYPFTTTQMISAKFYITSLLSQARSWSDLTIQNIPEYIIRDTTGLLQHVRLTIIPEGLNLGGLLNEGERVIARLLDPHLPHHKKMWSF